jgi:hypothetical protein
MGLIVMPKKKHFISDQERAKRLEEAAAEFGTSKDSKVFERAFKNVVKPAKPPAVAAKNR